MCHAFLSMISETSNYFFSRIAHGVDFQMKTPPIDGGGGSSVYI